MSTLEEVKDFAHQRSKKGSVVTLPVQFKLKNGQVSVLPGDDLYPENPNASESLIQVNKEVKEFREGIEKLHRIEFFNSHYAVIRQNFTPFCGHLKPIMTNPNNYD